ncbi:sugar-binding protein [Coraliomargarita parva]|uniref:sugar-binding protein n=1 Tax=Coraliomargarita parva TaxID=3014050 RepID=UPI0022B4155F|nr:sugar-binding protein [Coraliomargarita parva]
MDEDQFSVDGATRTSGVKLDGSLSEGAGTPWHAHPGFVLRDNGIGKGQVRYEGSGPASMSLFLGKWSSQEDRGVLLARICFDFGDTSSNSKTWFGAAISRNAAGITSNGLLWVMIKPNGDWQLRQLSKLIAQGKGAAVEKGLHEVSLRIAPSGASVDLLLDGVSLAKNVQCEQPVWKENQKLYFLVHYQWLGRQMSLDSMAVEWLPNVDFALCWLPSKVANGVFDLGQDVVLDFGIINKDEPKDLHLLCTSLAGDVLYENELAVEANSSPYRAKFRIPSGALKKHGAYQACISQSSQKSDPNIRQQFVVIPHRKITPNQFDRLSPYSTNYMRDWSLAARLGVKKLRRTYRTLEDLERYVERARTNGLLLNATLLDGPVIMRDAMPTTIQRSVEKVSKIFRDTKEAAGDVIYIEEIHNEPENWSPTPRNNQFIPLTRMIAEVTKNIRQSGLDLQVMSTGTTHANLSFLHQLATVGGPDATDVVAIHGYRSPLRPEFGHTEVVAAIRDLFGEKPIYVNEDAYFVWTPRQPGAVPSITVPSGSAIELDEVTQGIYLQRVYLNQLMAGFSLVNQFSGLPNHDLSASVLHRRPGLVNYSALTRILPHPSFVRRITPETESLWVLEWENDGIPVTTLWTLNQPERVELGVESFGSSDMNNERGIEVYDTYGNPIESPDSSRLSLSVGGAPVFIIGRQVSLLNRRLLLASDPKPSVQLPEECEDAPLDIHVIGGARNMNQAALNVIIKNTSVKPFRGRVELAFLNKAPQAWQIVPESDSSIYLQPGESVELPFIPSSASSNQLFDPYSPVPGKGYLALYWAEGYQVGVRVIPGDGSDEIVRQPGARFCFRGIPFMEKGQVTIDGVLDEWQSVPVFEQLGRQKRNVELARFWTGTQDYKPTFRFAWCEEGLLFAAEVIDDKHDATQKGLNAWRTDSVQLGIDLNHERTLRGQVNFLDYSVITLATSGAVLQRDTPFSKAGPLEEVSLKTSRIEGDYGVSGTTYYEALIPWSVLGQVAGEVREQKVLGFSVLFNESDGWWRCGWEGYFTPMGGQIVDPRYFGDLTLIREEILDCAGK